MKQQSEVIRVWLKSLFNESVANCGSLQWSSHRSFTR